MSKSFIRPSVCTFQGGFNYADFRDIWHWKLLWISFGKYQIWLKSGKVSGILCIYTISVHGGVITNCVAFQWVEVGQPCFKASATKMASCHKPLMITIKCQHLIWKIKHVGSTLMKYDHRAVIALVMIEKTRFSATLFTTNPSDVEWNPDHSKSLRRHGCLSLVSVLSGSGLCVGLITRPEKSYWVLGVPECDREVSIVRRSWPTIGCPAKKKNYIQICVA